VTHARNQLVAGDDDQGPGFVGDGTDTLRNIEKLQFSDRTITVEAPGAPTLGTATAGSRSAAVSWTAPASAGGTPITGYQVQASTAGSAAPVESTTAPAAATGLTMTGLTNGTAYTFDVVAINAVGTGPASARSAAVTPVTVPGRPLIGNASSSVVRVGTVNATARWAPPASNGGAPITGCRPSGSCRAVPRAPRPSRACWERGHGASCSRSRAGTTASPSPRGTRWEPAHRRAARTGSRPGNPLTRPDTAASPSSAGGAVVGRRTASASRTTAEAWATFTAQLATSLADLSDDLRTAARDYTEATEGPHLTAIGHSDYSENDTLSVLNQSRILVGQYERVQLEHGTVPR
jgi:hypothetical protein